MELNDYLRILRNHWIGVLALVIGAIALMGVYSLTQPKVYAADANAFVSAGGGSDPALSSVSDALAKSRAKSYVDIARSRATAQAAIDELGLDTSPAGLIGQITAEQPPDTVLIKITAADTSPVRAQRLADAWIRALAKQVAEIENPKGTNAKAIAIVPIEAAALPSSPISPDIKRNLLIGLAAGLLLGLGYALVRSQLDRRLRTASDIERIVDVPVVASVPRTPSLTRDAEHDNGLGVLSKADASYAFSAGEAFRKLRTNLQFMDVDNPPRVIVVTSPRPGDGKSTAAANLAAAIAISDSPVVLVDGDLRRPMIADTFGLIEGAGLTDVLAGRVQVEEVLQQHSGIDQLWVLGAGATPPNPSELLGSQAMRRLLGQLTERGTVIIDAPPLLPVTDGAVMSAIADGAFLVLSAGKTLDSELVAAVEHLEAVKGRALGIILNWAPARDTYAQSYGYYEGSATARGKERRTSRKAGRRSRAKRPATSANESTH